MTACPICGGVVERTSGEATRTICPGYYRSAADLYPQRVTVPLLACTSCEWVAEPARLQLPGLLGIRNFVAISGSSPRTSSMNRSASSRRMNTSSSTPSEKSGERASTTA